MTTIYTTLPIYDSVLKQDYQRTGAVVPIYSPRHRLPSWQYKTTETPGAVVRIDLVNAAGTLKDITTYFPILSDDYVLAASTYYKYDGDTLNYLLPYGAYYLKITLDNGHIYYSEWIVITDIYDKIVTSWTNSAYETFVSAGTAITSAIETGASGSAGSNQFSTRPIETITAIFFLTLTSGQAPTLAIDDGATQSLPTAAGLNVLSFTTITGSPTTSMEFSNTAASNFTTSEVYVIRTYSTNFIRIDFHDTHDLGDIVYQDGFTQSLWLQTQLNTPTHEPVLVGEEKNGIFIAEKIITKFKYRVVTYCGPVFYRAIMRLPQHDTITITDEVGFSYSPTVGNVQVNPVNWNFFDTGTLEIIFNDNSEFIWTSEANNLT